METLNRGLATIANTEVPDTTVYPTDAISVLIRRSVPHGKSMAGMTATNSVTTQVAEQIIRAIKLSTGDYVTPERAMQLLASAWGETPSGSTKRSRRKIALAS